MTVAPAGMPIRAGHLRQAAYDSVKLALIALLLGVPGRPVRKLRSVGGREAVEYRRVGTSLDFVLRWCCLSNLVPFAFFVVSDPKWKGPGGSNRKAQKK
jgi:hypothetical protein